MKKVLFPVIAFVVLAIGGYFVDPTYKSQVDRVFGRSNTTAASSTVVSNDSDATIVAAPSKSSTGSTLADMLDRGSVVASVQAPAKPFYDASSGQAEGFNVDFMHLLFDQPEFKGKIRSISAAEVDTYAAVPEQLLQGKRVDIAIDGLTFTDSDLKGVVYTIPYVKDFGYSLITKRGASIQAPTDLVGGTIGIIKGDPDVRAYVESAFADVKIVEVDERPDSSGKWMPRHLESGRVDAIVYDYPFAVAELEGTNLQFAIAKLPGSDIQYRIGVRKEDRDLLTALNTSIRRVLDTPEYDRMLKKYFMSKNVATARRASATEQVYVVESGDTLSLIAQKTLGDKMRYTAIQERNNLANPNFISVGQRLVIPK